MGLLGNYSVILKSPCRNQSGPLISDNRANFNVPGQMRGRYVGWDGGFDRHCAEPDGCNPPYSWVIAQYSGGMSSHQNVTGKTSMTANLAGGINNLSNQTGTATLSANVSSLGNVSCGQSGSATVSANIYATLPMSASLDSASTIGANIVALGFAAVDISSHATLSGTGALVIDMSASLSGSGNVSTARLSILLFATSSLTSSSSVTAGISAIGNIDGSSLTGTSSLSVAVSSRGFMSANFGATATISASPSAKGDLSCSLIVSYTVTVDQSSLVDAVWNALLTNYDVAGTMGAGLSNASSAGDPWSSALPGIYASGTAGYILGNQDASIAAAVWAALLEEGYDASQVMRIIAAVVAGKSSGGPNSPIFRNIGDTQNQVTGTVDSNGNRSAITYGN